MGSRGPPPKPTALLELAGSWRAKSRPDEPQPELGAPEEPSWLDREARAEWRRVVPELERTGVLATIDRAILSAYCQRWADYVSLNRQVRRAGRTFRTPLGYIAKNPKVTMLNEALADMLKLSDRLGLSPASRARVHGSSQESSSGKDDAARFFA